MRKSDKHRDSTAGKNPHVKKQKSEYDSKAPSDVDALNDEDFYNVDAPPPPDRSREHVLQCRLEKLIARLIVNDGPKDVNKKQDSLRELIVSAIEVSRLNKRDPELATEHPFKGKLKFRREGITNFTSIFRFVYDVECLLRELFGDVEGDDLDELLRAIWTIVMEFTKHLCPDIHQEYRDAHEYEYDQAWIVAPALTNRAMQVSVRPDDYGWYTKKFVKSLEKYWPELISWIPGRPHRLKSNT
jgi:hypothetical protein